MKWERKEMQRRQTVHSHHGELLQSWDEDVREKRKKERGRGNRKRDHRQIERE